MQTREKYLAIGLGVVLAVYAGRGIFTPLVQGPLDDRERQLAIAQRRLDSAEADELETLAATQTLSDQAGRAIGADALVAQRRYIAWLTDLADACDWTDVQLRPGRISPINPRSSRISVNLTGRATWAQLTDFLGRYEAAGLLHGLTRLETTADNGKAETPLGIELSSTGISVRSSDRTTLPLPDPVESVDWAALAAGSLFGTPTPAPPAGAPPNQPPELLLPDPITIGPSETALDYATAFDPDGADDGLAYRLTQPVEGASIDAATGEVRYVPPAFDPLAATTDAARDEAIEGDRDGSDSAGRNSADEKEATAEPSPVTIDRGERTVRLGIEVTDADGGSAGGVWTITVTADAAATTELIGSLMIDGQPVAWTLDRLAGQRRELRTGDSLAIGDVRGEVAAIRADAIEYETDNGRVRWKLGQTLRDAQPMQ